MTENPVQLLISESESFHRAFGDRLTMLPARRSLILFSFLGIIVARYNAIPSPIRVFGNELPIDPEESMELISLVIGYLAFSFLLYGLQEVSKWYRSWVGPFLALRRQRKIMSAETGAGRPWNLHRRLMRDVDYGNTYRYKPYVDPLYGRRTLLRVLIFFLEIGFPILLASSAIFITATWTAPVRC